MDMQTEIASALQCCYKQITSNLQVDLRSCAKIGKAELADYVTEIKSQFIEVYGHRGSEVEVTAHYDPLVNKIDILIRNAPIPIVSQKLRDEDECIYDTVTANGVYIGDEEQLSQLGMRPINMPRFISAPLADLHKNMSSDFLKKLLYIELDKCTIQPMLTRLLGWTQPPDNDDLQHDVSLLLKIILLENFKECLEDDSINWRFHAKTESLSRVGVYQPDILFTIDVESFTDPASYQAHYVAEAVINGERQRFNIGYPYNVYSSSRKICQGQVTYINSPSFVAQWLTGICNYDLCDPYQQTAFPVLDALFRAGVFDDECPDNSDAKLTAIVELLNEWGDAMNSSSIKDPHSIHLEHSGVVPIEPNTVICHRKDAVSFLDSTGSLCFGTGFIMDNCRFYAFPDGKRQWIFDADGTYLTQAPIDFQFNHHGI